VEQFALHNRNWKKVSKAIPTRTIMQVRTHAQKYFLSLERPNSKKMRTTPLSAFTILPGAQAVAVPSTTTTISTNALLPSPKSKKKSVCDKEKASVELHFPFAAPPEEMEQDDSAAKLPAPPTSSSGSTTNTATVHTRGFSCSSSSSPIMWMTTEWAVEAMLMALVACQPEELVPPPPTSLTTTDDSACTSPPAQQTTRRLDECTEMIAPTNESFSIKDMKNFSQKIQSTMLGLCDPSELSQLWGDE
jgi:hypothetical protein